MSSRNLIIVSVLFAVAMSPVIMADDPVSADSVEETWYCYGDVILLKYPYDDAGIAISWQVTGYKDGVGSPSENHEGITVSFLKGDYDYFVVKQIVTEVGGTDYDSKTIDVIPLGLLSGDSISVRFVDGFTELSRYTITGSNSVMLGNPFVDLPDNPSKTNYRFTGWFVDQACTQPFNPYIPILSDTTVYAGWTSAGSSDSITVSGYVVTFNAAPGLTYQVVGTGDRAVSFTVSVMDGYRFDMDSIQVSVGTTKILLVNGIYTLPGITKDTVIEITGDRLYNVSYDMSNVSISSEDLRKDSLSVSFSPSFGWSGVSLKVIMGGTDVTSQYVNGSSVDIDQLTGDVIIMAQADLPWIYVLVIVIIVAIALVAVLLSRKRKSD